MATTKSSDGPTLETLPFPEQDKLGPLGSKRSVFDDEAELRRVLVAEFQGAADAARDAAASVDRHAANAVHDYRKALRRARAILKLVAAALPKSERRAVGRALQEARRAVSTVRDHAVAPEAVDMMSLGEDERETARAIIRTANEAIPPIAEIKQLLAEGAARTAAQVEALEAALPRTIAWSVVEEGIREVYAEARISRKAAKKSKRSFHRWRRRSKELSYQLELIEDYAGLRVGEIQREIEGATDTQGPAVDLIMMRDFVKTHGGGVAKDALDRLLDAINRQAFDLMKASRKAGREAFRRKPSRFARRLTKAVRRDLAPVAPADDIAGD
jgi:CHAD domain-containing protein